ncbi:hypothetical protein [Nostoc sp. ChiSLP03a]|uniref:hypothetical protein n=1 Tax=Nostoc sp. ChiSLP03a TaxID=3075380 RepID=UPI002AD4CE23|nr:hypothetical protein [Nostoc sp. ChiSLP03a]MDZ8214830.1 hypothetical protein [Nostoc sp. ChiSLP03a]
MINDQEFLHGAAFLRLIDYGERLTITHASSIHSSIYLVETENSKSAILFKVSKKPKSAWSFTFSSQEELALDTLHSKYHTISVFLALICHKDGICCISQQRLWSILDKYVAIAGQHISVSRKIHGSYHVSGPGKQHLDQTVPQNDWPRVLFSN